MDEAEDHFLYFIAEGKEFLEFGIVDVGPVENSVQLRLAFAAGGMGDFEKLNEFLRSSSAKSSSDIIPLSIRWNY